jgi:hypothetical protein
VEALAKKILRTVSKDGLCAGMKKKEPKQRASAHVYVFFAFYGDFIPSFNKSRLQILFFLTRRGLTM